MATEPTAPDAQAPWGRGEDGRPCLLPGKHWTDIPELLDRRISEIQERVDAALPGGWFDAPEHRNLPPGTVCTYSDGYTLVVGSIDRMRPADKALTLNAQSDLHWCLEMIGQYRAQIAILEAQVATGRADGIREAADDLAASCPEHTDSDEVWTDCPCNWVDELRRIAEVRSAMERPEPWLASDAIAAELHRRNQALEALNADPTRHTARESVRGEILGLQVALAISLGSPATGDDGLKVARAYYQEWLRRQSTTEQQPTT